MFISFLRYDTNYHFLKAGVVEMVIRRYVNFHDLSKRLKANEREPTMENAGVDSKEAHFNAEEEEERSKASQVVSAWGEKKLLIVDGIPRTRVSSVIERRLISKSSVVVFEDNPEEVCFDLSVRMNSYAVHLGFHLTGARLSMLYYRLTGIPCALPRLPSSTSTRFLTDLSWPKPRSVARIAFSPSIFNELSA